MFHSLGKASFCFLAKLFDVSPATTYQWIRKTAEILGEPVVAEGIQEVEIDEMWHFLSSKNKRWIIKALDRNTGRTIASVVGGRDAATVRRLYCQLEHLSECFFYIDDWDALAKVLPAEQHVIGKKHATSIEPDNSNSRHHLGRMRRRTKIVSQSEEMISLSIGLWHALTTQENFLVYQNKFISSILQM